MTFKIRIFIIQVLSFNLSDFLNAGVTAHKLSHKKRIHSLNRRKVLPYAPDGLDTTHYDESLTTECSVPSISKTITVSSPTTVAAGETFDCQLAKYQHTDTSCDLESEKGNAYAVFLLEEGATLKNCFLGYSQESVHCKGSCTVENCHWLELCDDGIMFHMDSGEATVTGCSFSNAGNKALQFNGGGTVNVDDVCFYNVDIAYRSCGSGCRSSAKRAVIFNNVELKGVTTLAGFNHADGDTVDIRSYSGQPAKAMCQDKAASTSGDSVPPGCTIGGSSSSNDSTMPSNSSSTVPSNSSSTVPSASDDSSTSSDTESKDKSKTDKSKSSTDKSDTSTDLTDPSTENSTTSTEETGSSSESDEATEETKSKSKRSKPTKKRSKDSKSPSIHT